MMNVTADTTMNAEENIDARVLSIGGSQYASQRHVENPVNNAPAPLAQDQGERFAQLMEYCDSPEGMTREK